MSPSLTTLRDRHWRRILLSCGVLLCGWAWGEQSAHAGCGDYVVIGSGLTKLGHDNPGHERRSPAEPGRPRCHGPGCQSAPATPFVPAKIVQYHDQTWGLATAFQVPHSSVSHAWPREDDLIRPLIWGRGVFHPPRQAA